MVKMSKGIVSATPVHKRCVKSATSGFGPSSAAGTPTGSSAMPHFGHSPGASRMTSGQPMIGQGFELTVISACVLGGVSLKGGIGKISYVVAGILILGTVDNAMNLLNISPFSQYVVRGVILLAAVIFDRYKQKAKRAA